jgi:hypothetical protein
MSKNNDLKRKLYLVFQVYIKVFWAFITREYFSNDMFNSLFICNDGQVHHRNLRSVIKNFADFIRYRIFQVKFKFITN